MRLALGRRGPGAGPSLRRHISSWPAALLGTLVTAQGCLSNGDASLGNDGTTAGSGRAGDSGQAGSTALGSGGKSNAGGASLASGGKSVVPSTGGATRGRVNGATLVFSQERDLVAALPKLLQHARRFFAAELDVLSGSSPDRSEPEQAEVTVLFEARRYPGRGRFRLVSRPSIDDDRFAAEAAEARGQAGGMSLLAARCPVVWEVSALDTPTGTAELQLAALLASVALGPVLPADGSTLYGVRGAMERAEKAAQNRNKP